MKKTYVLGIITASLLITGCAHRGLEVPPKMRTDVYVKPPCPLSDTTMCRKHEVAAIQEPVEQPKVAETIPAITEQATIVPAITEQATIVPAVAKVNLTTLHFGIDKYNLEKRNMKIAKINAIKIKDHKVILEGNTDEYGTLEYNERLGLKRADTVRKVLMENGIPEASISIKSYGKNNLKCKEKTKICHAINRRVELVIVK
jgi:peptidoglycan-associated lipoprotein